MSHLVGKPLTTIVAAVAEDGAMGHRGGLPWRLPDELQAFKSLTMGSTLIVGRKTYETLPKLPGRRIIVVSSGQVVGAEATTTLEEAISVDPAHFVIGGPTLYAYALEHGLVETAFVTVVEGSFPDADVRFDLLSSLNGWQRASFGEGKGWKRYLYQRHSF